MATPVFLDQPRRDGIQSGLVAGNEDEVMPATGKTFGVDFADTGGCAGDENCWEIGHDALSLYERVLMMTVIIIVLFMMTIIKLSTAYVVEFLRPIPGKMPCR